MNTRFFTPLLSRKLESLNESSCLTINDFTMCTHETTDSLLKYITSETRKVIIIDISALVWRYTLVSALQLVHKLIAHAPTVAILHKDTHLPSDVSQIEVFATAVIKLFEIKDESVSVEGEEKVLDKSLVHFGCDVQSIRLKSKLISGREYFKIIDEQSGVFSFVRDPFVSIKKKQDGDRPMNTDDIDRQVPFKISMSEQEKKSRDNATVKQEQKKGFIIVDDEDSGDDSDPDDDLDI